ncbi:MAG: hypothetical protein ACEQR4_04105, partial [Rhodoluna sp.]
MRRDESQPNTLNMWVVADNLRKRSGDQYDSNCRVLNCSKIGVSSSATNNETIY